MLFLALLLIAGAVVIMVRYDKYSSVPLWELVAIAALLSLIEIYTSPVIPPVRRDCQSVVILRDNPVVSDDHRRRDYARAIVDAINTDAGQDNGNVKDAYTINIDERYGQGKTSFFRLIKNELENDNICFIDFSPWRNAHAGSMTEALFNEIVAALRPYISITEVRIIYKYVSLVVHKADSTGLLAPVFDYITAAKQSGSTLYKDIQKALKKLKYPLVIFIDDVDRLQHDELWHLCSLIRDTANFPYLYFILAADIDYVSATMADEKRDKRETERYLRKIINLNLQLPKASLRFIEKEFKGYLEETLKSMKAAPEVITGIMNVLFNANNPLNANIISLFPDLREVKRFISMLHIDIAARTADNIAENLDLLDFIRIELIKHFDRLLYRNLRDKPYLTLSVNNRLYELPGQLASNITEDFGRTNVGNQSKDNRKDEAYETLLETYRIESTYIYTLLFQMFPTEGFIKEWAARVPYLTVEPSVNSIRRLNCYDNYFTNLESYDGMLTFSRFAEALEADAEECKRRISEIKKENNLQAYYSFLRSYMLSTKNHQDYDLPKLFNRIFKCVEILVEISEGNKGYVNIRNEIVLSIPVPEFFIKEKSKLSVDSIKNLQDYLFDCKDYLKEKVALLSAILEIQHLTPENCLIQFNFLQVRTFIASARSQIAAENWTNEQDLISINSDISVIERGA